MLEPVHVPSSNALETVNHILANINAYAKNPDLFHRKRSLLSPIAPSPPPLVVSHSSPALQHHLPLRPKIDVVEVVQTDSPASDANLIQLDCVSPPASISALQRLGQENHKSADVNLLANEPIVATDIGLVPQTKSVKAVAARKETFTLESEQHNDVIMSDNKDIQATVEDRWRQIVSAADSTSVDHVTLVSFNDNYNHPSFPPSWTGVDFAARDLPSIASETSANVTEINSLTTAPFTRVITITRNGTSDFSNASESQQLSTIVTESEHSSSSRTGVNTGLRRRSGTLPHNFIVETFEESLSSSIKTDSFTSPHTASAASVTPKASPVPPVRTHRPGHLHQQHQQQVVERADVIHTQQPTVTVSVSMQLHDELALKSAALRVTERRDRWPGAMLASSSAITEPEFV